MTHLKHLFDIPIWTNVSFRVKVFFKSLRKAKEGRTEHFLLQVIKYNMYAF
jgi:hypothetical protein